MPEATPAIPSVITAAAHAAQGAQPTTPPPPAAETGTPPPPAAAPAPKTEPDPRLASRFAQLAKQEAALRSEKQRIASERSTHEQAIRSKEEAIAARAAKADDLERRLAAAKKDPAGFLRSVYGEEWYDQLTEVKLSGEKATPDLAVQALREEALSQVEALKKEQADRWKQLEDERKASQEAERARAAKENADTLEKFRTDTIDFVKANPEKYELTNLTESQGLVAEVIAQAYARTKRLMKHEEAADLVEKSLEEQAEKVFAGKKWQARAQKPPVTEQTNGSARTLTNDAAAGTPAAAVPQKYKSSDERLKAAVAAMEAIQRQQGGQT